MGGARPRRWSGLALFSVLLHGVWVAFFLWIACAIWIRGEPAPPEAGDSVKIAAQMGHLDLISLSLTVLSVVLALIAVGGFFLLRGAVINAAHDEVEDQMTKRGEQWVANAVDEYMRRNGDALIGVWLENNPGELRGAIELVLAANEPNLDTEEMIRRMDEN